MGKDKVIIFSIIMSVMILSLFTVSSQLSTLGTFKQSQEISLIQLCSNCTYNNITSVVSPNSTLLVGNVVMTKDGTNYNYSLLLNNTAELGSYNVNGFGDEDGEDQIWSYTFEVTKNGTILETSESLIFILLTLGFLFFFLLSFYFAVTIPYKNEVNEQGMTIKVSKLKYVKLFFVMLSYLLFIVFLNALIGLAINFVSLTLFFGIIGFLFETMNNLALPFGIFIIVLAFFEVIRDSNFNKNMKDLMGAMR